MTAALQPETRSPSRRALLAGALGGLGALAASAIGRVSPMRAAQGDPMIVGSFNTAAQTTELQATEGHTAFAVTSIGAGITVETTSAFLAPVAGRSLGNSTGVQGYSGTAALPAAKAKTGVYGYAAQDNASQGVWGHSPAGNGVVGSTSSGFAGYFSGKVYSTQFYELSEIGTPAAPAPNRARLFVKDNGAGKTQLCVRFHTGAVKVIVTEP